jgi:predicted flap endonuclease-1-like 5' DNA nuclease
MRVLRVFFLGVVYGWLMRWIIDEIYTRDHLRMITNENTLLRERLRELEAPKSLSLVPEQRTGLMPAPLQRPEPRQEPASSPASTPTPPPAKPVQRGNQKDDLKLIKGIGPKLEKKLNGAGVRTFDQMSRLTTAELQAILGISKRGLQNADNLISQARKFAHDNANL